MSNFCTKCFYKDFVFVGFKRLLRIVPSPVNTSTGHRRHES